MSLRGGQSKRRYLAAVATGEIDDRHGFFNVKLARVSLCVDALEIVQAIGEVGVLLDFTKNHSGADGVRRSGRNKKGIAGENRQALKRIFQTAFFYGGLKLLWIRAGHQAEQQRGAGLRGNGVPHFRLAARAGSFIFAGESVVRMDLDGKLSVGNRNFTSKGKSPVMVALRNRSRAIRVAFCATPSSCFLLAGRWKFRFAGR